MQGKEFVNMTPKAQSTKAAKWSENLSSHKSLRVNVFGSFSHHHPKQKIIQLSLKWERDKQIVCIHTEHSSVIKRNNETCNNMDKYQMQCAKKPDPKRLYTICFHLHDILQRQHFRDKPKNQKTDHLVVRGLEWKGRIDYTGHGGNRRVLRLFLHPDGSCGYINAYNSKLAETHIKKDKFYCT